MTTVPRAADPTLVPAGSLTVAELTALFNAGYGGYLVPLAFDEPTRRRHLEGTDIDLGVSRVPSPVSRRRSRSSAGAATRRGSVASGQCPEAGSEDSAR